MQRDTAAPGFNLDDPRLKQYDRGIEKIGACIAKMESQIKNLDSAAEVFKGEDYNAVTETWRLATKKMQEDSVEFWKLKSDLREVEELLRRSKLALIKQMSTAPDA